ncbi:MAG: GNAT family N-acetyltransferase [Actinomycetota bacterium]
MSEGARLARVDDLPRIDELIAAVRLDMAPRRGGELFLAREAGWPEVARDVERSVDGDDDRLAVVGTYDDVVFGVALADIETLADGRRIGVLTAFLVEEDARDVGIGEAMMNLVIERLRAADCVGVDSVALPGDRATKNFFESFGLKARLLTVHRAFDVET